MFFKRPETSSHYNKPFVFALFGFLWVMLFFSWYIPHKSGLNTLAIQSEDTLPAMFLPFTILKTHTLYLDDYYDMLVHRYPQPDDKHQLLGLTPYYLRKVSKDASFHYVSAFPILTPVLVLPLYVPVYLLHLPVTWDLAIYMSGLASSFIVSLLGVAFYIFVARYFYPEDYKAPFWKQRSLRLSLILVFGTINYALTSQALWQHGVAQFFTVLFLFALFSRASFFVGLTFGFMLLARPTTLLSGLLLLYYFWLFIKQNPKKLFAEGYRFLLGFLIPISFFLWYNHAFYVSVGNQGYSNQIFTEWRGRFPEGLLGLWLSPSKGLLVYSPVFIYSLYGFWVSIKSLKSKVSENRSVWFVLFGLVAFLHTLILGKWKHWYGGWSFGYRMASDILPYLVLLLIPALECLTSYLWFVLTCAISLGFELMGLVFFDGIWHAAYDKGFIHTQWLWSIRNSELFFNIRRALVKFGLRDTPF